MLTIRIIDKLGRLEIEITDDGIGRTESKRIKTENQKAGKSTGIKNTSNRLQLLNEVHQLDITSAIENLNEDGSGTRVLLNLPQMDVNEMQLDLQL